MPINGRGVPRRDASGELGELLAQRGTVIETGRVRVEGTSAELGANPEIRAAYLGI
jgi:ABC-type branched-subunit amino acid transport system ATPase component